MCNFNAMIQAFSYSEAILLHYCNTIAFYLTKYVPYVMNLLYMYIFLTAERANFTYLSQFVVLYILGLILTFNTQSNRLSTWYNAPVNINPRTPSPGT